MKCTSYSGFSLVSWNVNGVKAGLNSFSSFFSLLSHSMFTGTLHCSKRSLKPPFRILRLKIPLVLLSPLRAAMIAVSFIGIPPPVRSRSRQLKRNEGYQLFCNSGHYSVVVALNRNLAARGVWHDTCDFASAVILGCSVNIFVISAYLPNPGLGLDLYMQALAATSDLIKSAPRDFKYMFLGCDSNCKLFNHCELDHVVGPLTYPGQSVRSGDRERSEAFIALALEHCLRAANTFRPAPSDAAQLGSTEELSETWTHFLYPNPRVRSQIDWVLCSQTLEASAKVVYSIDCDSGHKSLHLSLPQSPLDIVNASSSPRAQKCRRAKSRKGWQPINEEAAATFTLAMHGLPPDPCVSTVQKHLMKAVFHASFTSASDIKPKHSMPEPDDVSEARLALAACTDAGDRHRMARVVYRRKRCWLAALAHAKFERSALSLPRCDKIGSRKMQWMWDLEGNKSYDPVKWEDSMRAHYDKLFSSSLEDQETKRERPLALETSCFADHGNGVHSWIHLPLHTLLDTRMKMQRCKAPGVDGLVYEMFLLLDWDTVETLRVSFEKHFNCVNGFVEAIPEWLSVAVCTVPKDRNAHSCEKLRPLSLLSALNT